MLLLDLPNYQIVTPVKSKIFINLLTQHPDHLLVEFLQKGFTQAFSLGYQGPLRNLISPSLKSVYQYPNVFQAKVTKELQLGRFLGPFDLLFNFFKQFPWD